MKYSGLIEFLKHRKFVLRLGAIGLAILLWLFVISSENYLMTMSVPIEVRNLSTQKALLEEVPHSAQVKFSGTGRNLFKTFLLKRFYGDFKLVLDLERISDEYEFVLNRYYRDYPKKIVIPNVFDIEYMEVVSPREITISLGDYATKKIPIFSNIFFQPAPGYIITGNVIINPEQIEIAGPHEIVEVITSLSTIIDTLPNLTTSIVQRFEIDSIPTQLQLSSTVVSVAVNVQAISEKIVSEVPITVINVPIGYRVFVSPQTVSLTVIGGIDQILNIEPEDISLTVDFARHWNLQKQFYEPLVMIPAGLLDWQDLSPRNVELIVTRENN